MTSSSTSTCRHVAAGARRSSTTRTRSAGTFCLRSAEGVTLATIETRPELLDRYIARKRREELAPKTIANHLRTLSAMFEYARRRRRMQTNPVDLLEPLHVPTPETPVLSEARGRGTPERLQAGGATRRNPASANGGSLARRLTAFALGTALRRGEILALRWSRRRDARTPATRSALVRSWRDGGAEVESRSAHDRLRAAHRPTFSRSSSRRACTARRTRSCSVTRRSARRSIRRSCRATCGRRSPGRASSERSAPWHDLRHTALTHDAAAGNPAVYVAGASGSRAGDDDRAVRPRRAGRVPRRCGSSRGSSVRGSRRLRRVRKRVRSRGRSPGRSRRLCPFAGGFEAPRVGLEPTTLRLTAGCSAN